MSELLKYGIRNNTLVSIDNVASGLKCNCVCPSCGATLMAKKGSVREHHFAHYIAAECEHARESALHIMAKQVLFNMKKVYLPLNIHDQYRKGSIVQFNNATLESRKFGTFIPDVLFEGDKGTVAVEVLVTHSVDHQKMKLIFDSKIDTLEIDLSGIIDDYNEDKITRYILAGYNNRWIYNSRIDKQIRTYKAQHINDYYQIEDDYNICPKSSSNCVYMMECVDCSYRDIYDSKNKYGYRACFYRHRYLRSNSISIIDNEVRTNNGVLLSIDILTPNGWETWCGEINQTMTKKNKV